MTTLTLERLSPASGAFGRSAERARQFLARQAELVTASVGAGHSYELAPSNAAGAQSSPTSSAAPSG